MKTAKLLLLTTLTITTVFLGLYIYARYIEPNLLMVNRVSLKGSKVEVPIKIVFFGDTHMGKFNNIEQLSQIVEKINSENPDLVIFTGDLIDSKAGYSVNSKMISWKLSKIQATYGKFGVMGNHEYALLDEFDYKKLMNAGGFQVLTNDWLDIPEINLRLLGLDDAYRGTPDLSLTADAFADTYNILLTHEPDIVDQMDLDNIQLILAGHTHGGQISIPFLTEKILPVNGRKYVKGLFKIGTANHTNLFVTKGTGMTKLPFRFLNVPEIVSIEITP